MALPVIENTVQMLHYSDASCNCTVFVFIHVHDCFMVSFATSARLQSYSLIFLHCKTLDDNVWCQAVSLKYPFVILSQCLDHVR